MRDKPLDPPRLTPESVREVLSRRTPGAALYQAKLNQVFGGSTVMTPNKPTISQASEAEPRVQIDVLLQRASFLLEHQPGSQGAIEKAHDHILAALLLVRQNGAPVTVGQNINPDKACGRCGMDVRLGAEVCRKCQWPLCDACWEAHGECAHSPVSTSREPRCICGDGNPADYEGPREDCPEHGKQVQEDALIGLAEALLECEARWENAERDLEECEAALSLAQSAARDYCDSENRMAAKLRTKRSQFNALVADAAVLRNERNALLAACKKIEAAFGMLTLQGDGLRAVEACIRAAAQTERAR